MTNDQLRRRLVDDFGQTCGPIVPSTRKLFIKKLARLEAENVAQPVKVAPSKPARNSVNIFPQNNTSITTLARFEAENASPPPKVAASKPARVSVAKPPRVSVTKTSPKIVRETQPKIVVRETPPKVTSSPRKTVNTSFTPLARPPLQRNSVLNYSDSESDSELDLQSNERFTKLLLNHRPTVAKSAAKTSALPRSLPSRVLSFFTFGYFPGTTPSSPTSGSSSTKTSSLVSRTAKPEENPYSEESSSQLKISRLLLRFVICFFIFIALVYFLSQAKLFINKNRSTIVTVLLASLGAFISVFYIRHSQKKSSEEQMEVERLIEESIELLQSPDEPQSPILVLHIRDTLIPPADRVTAKYKKIWSKVVAHMEGKHESRVKAEFVLMDGDSYKAWKWNGLDRTSNSSMTFDTR